MNEGIEIKVSLKLGPISVEFESNPGDELIWCDESAFMQKILDLRKYYGDPDNPPEAPAPAIITPPHWSTTVGPMMNQPVVLGGGSMAVEGAQPSSYGMVPDDDELPIYTPEPEVDLYDDDDDDDDVGEVPQGKRVGRISGTQFANKVDGEK